LRSFITSGTFEDVRLDLLDPADEDDRLLLIRSEHPELADAFEDERDEVGAGSGVMNTRLHLLMHQAVASQIWDDDPPEVWRTAQRLTATGYDRHEVLHMLASVLVDDLWRVQHEQAPFGRDRFLAGLEELPGSWEADREEDLDHDVEELVETALEILAELGPLAPEELGRHLDEGPTEVDLVAEDPRVVVLGDSRLASVPALFADTTITHRLTDDEAGGTTVALGVDLVLLSRLLHGDHLHLATGPATVSEEAEGAVLEGPDGWLGTAAAGKLVGFRLGPGVVEVVPEPRPALLPDTVAARLRSSFHRFGEGDGMPVEVAELLCQLAVDAPALVGGVLAPIGELLARAGFEARHGYAAPAGTDWDTFGRLREVAMVASEHGLGPEEGHALVMVSELARLFRLEDLGALDRGVADEVGRVLDAPGVGEAFAEATEEHPPETRAFLAAARRRASRRHHASLAWSESLVAGRAGEPEQAEELLRAALLADPEYPPALEDAAWYASDRGDAAGALRFLDRLEEDPDEARTALLRRYVGRPGSSAGRNDPCPCGSGRKYKHCCLQASSAPGAAPLPERVRWLWEKLRWWLDRDGREPDALDLALVLQGDAVDDELALLADLDVAASLLLFADGAVREFLRQRGALLPGDERNLVAQWTLAERSVHEVTRVRSGEGMTLRDLRTGDVVDVTERRGSAAVRAGDLLFAHPVFDGEGYQLVGGVVPVPLFARDAVLAALDAGGDSEELAAVLGATRRLPELVNMEGEAIVACEASYRTNAPRQAEARLDTVLEAAGDGAWEEWVEVDGRRWLRSRVSLDGDVLTLSAHSEERFDRLRDVVAAAVPGLELLSEERVPAATATRRSSQRRSASASPGGAAADVPPEAIEALSAFVREQEARWVDEPVPALAGLTPRQAAGDPTRREDLVALLHEFDRQAPPPGAVTFDPDRLRALLGLDDG
jgi:tetratricopeptide (TPR) repeat protein